LRNRSKGLVLLNYYAFHLGDYSAHTAHLDLLEDLAYRRLIDLHMLLERPLAIDVEEIARKIRMRDHAAVVRDVLNEFFVRTDDGWTNDRCMKEIAKYQSNKDAAKRAGQASAQRRTQAKATDVQRPFNDRSTQPPEPVQPTKNQEPRTKPINQEPKKEKNKEGQPALVLPEWMPAEVWQSWRQHRKAIRKPLTDAAAALTLRTLCEIFDAGHDPVAALQLSIANGWTGVFPPKPVGRAMSSPAPKTALQHQADVIDRILRRSPVNHEIDVHEPRLSLARD
jgi:uncharacterized protein YdaU (DUF1376 family)